MLTRFDAIRNHRIFLDYKWPNTLQVFSRRNLIFGWNGTGKTTLANLFRTIENRLVPEGQVEVTLDGAKAKLGNLPQTGVNIKVFNEDFIRENVFTVSGSVAPIFVLGEQNIEKQTQLSYLQREVSARQQEISQAQTEVAKAEKELDKYQAAVAKEVKLLLSSSGKNPYNTYTKSKYAAKAEKLMKPGNDLSLSSQEIIKLKKVITSTPKEHLRYIYEVLPDIQSLSRQVAQLLTKTITADTIEELKNDPQLSLWVKEGLSLHNSRNSNQSCLFCGQDMPPGLVERLEAHFNQQYSSFLAEIDGLIQKFQHISVNLNTIRPPDKAALYDHLAETYVVHVAELHVEIGRLETELGKFIELLVAKKAKVFEVCDVPFTEIDENNMPLLEINRILEKHNRETDDFSRHIEEAREKLENSVIIDSLPTYRAKVSALKESETKLAHAKESISELEQQKDALELEIISHRQPADELNDELRQYLGHDNLNFKVMEFGYLLMRKGEPAVNLSEGEKTAIALLYFLKSLKDKSFDQASGIVVLDDPILNLDSNSLYSAFNYLKDRLQSVNQLFILTHNFAFLRMVKHWFKQDQHIATPNYYMLKTSTAGSDRNTEITALDDMLRNNDSEYRYLFSLVYNAAHAVKTDALYFNAPIVARRLLENFMVLRKPTFAGNIQLELSNITYDPEKVIRICEFLGACQPQLSCETNTQQVFRDILAVMQHDESHYAQLEEMVHTKA